MKKRQGPLPELQKMLYFHRLTIFQESSGQEVAQGTGHGARGTEENPCPDLSD